MIRTLLEEAARLGSLALFLIALGLCAGLITGSV